MITCFFNCKIKRCNGISVENGVNGDNKNMFMKLFIKNVFLLTFYV